MAEEEGAKQTEGTVVDDSDKKEQATQEKTVPYDRFKEINDKLKEQLAKVKEFEDKQAEADEEKRKSDEERLKKQGEFEALATKKTQEADTYKTQLESEEGLREKFQAQFEVGVKEMLKALPDSVKALYPYDEKPGGEELLKAYEWLAKASSTTGETKPGLGGSPKPAGGGKKVEEEALAKTKARYRKW